jgi:hypothetical protein
MQAFVRHWFRAEIALALGAALLGLFLLIIPLDYYEWIKAFHVIAVIAWMAGMLYLPRLFIYHCEAEPGSKQSETFKVMERRLLRAIINPAMVVTWAAGCRQNLSWSSFSRSCTACSRAGLANLPRTATPAQVSFTVLSTKSPPC